MAKRLLFDADPSCGDWKKNEPCPAFIANFDTNEVELKDKYGHIVPMDTKEYNEFVQMARSGSIKKVPMLLTGNEIYTVGSTTFSADTSKNKMVFASRGKIAEIDVEHFNTFIDAVIDGKMQEVEQ